MSALPLQSSDNTLKYVIKAESESNKGLIMMTGYISPWENSSVQFRNDFKNLEDSYEEIDILIMNLYGGSVVEGIPTYNLIKDSSSKTNTIVQGLAASMGGILALAGNQHRIMDRMSRIMFHRAKAGIFGDADDLKEGGDMVQSYENDLADVIVANSNKDKDYVLKNWMKRGKDTYLTAKQALEFGLVTQIADSEIKKDVPKNILKEGVENILAYYSEQLPQINNLLNVESKPLKMKKVISALGLPENATEDQVLEAVNNKAAAGTPEDKKRIADLEAEIKRIKDDVKEKNAENLVNSAIDSKKITVEQKDHFKKLALADYDSTKAILDGMKGFNSISSQVEAGKKDDPYAEKDFNWLHKNAPEYLQNMKKEQPERYKTLFNNRKAAK